MHILRKFRESLSLTQAELGCMLGFEQGSISNIETGKRKLDPSQVKKISEITGIPKHELRPDIFER